MGILPDRFFYLRPMTLSQQLIFLFSAFGGVNGLSLSAYFLLLKKEKRISDYCLGGLLLMLSVRVIKSVFLNFNPDLFELFIQIGLSACMLIGPFLYLYVLSATGSVAKVRKRWWLYILPFFIIILYLLVEYPYTENRRSWDGFVFKIYVQWGLFILASAWEIRHTLRKLFTRDSTLSSEEKWLLNIYFGVTIVWLAYITGYYTSYIVGALSFSFIFYVSILLFVYHRNKHQIAIDPPTKYANSSLGQEEVENIMQRLEHKMKAEQLYLDHNLTLAKLSQDLNISAKELSQCINQSTGGNYSRYISTHRVEEAKLRLKAEEYAHLKISSIAHDSGFNSLSSFNAAFKKQVGVTASVFRKG